MELIRVLHEWGFLRNDRIRMQDQDIRILDAIAAYLLQSPEGRHTKLYGYALHVEVVGEKDGQKQKHVLTHTHPPSDGTVKDWDGLRAYTRNVGIPLSIGAQMITTGLVQKTGVLAPELAFAPETVFQELARREILIQEQITPQAECSDSYVR